MSNGRVSVALEIHRGHSVGESMAVTHSPFRVGSGHDSDWALSDSHLAWNHFEIQITETEVRVHGLLIDGPVYVNGERVIGHALAHEDLILAGATEFRVRIAEPVPLPAPAPFSLPVIESPPLVVDELALYHLGESSTRKPFAEDSQRPMFAPPPESAHRLMQFRDLADFRPTQAGGVLYGLADSAQDFEWAFTTMRKGYDLVSLFLGELSRELIDVAPYFFQVRWGSGLLGEWVGKQGKNLGILIDSPAPPLEVFLHLRQTFVARDETGQEYFFRYYDPRVLRTFLPACSSEELAEFFGPISGILVECDGDEGYQLFRRDDAGNFEQISLGPLYLEHASSL